MTEYPLVPESQRLERTDLCLLTDRYPVHRCDHCQYRDRKEEYREYGTHCFAFVHLAS